MSGFVKAEKRFSVEDLIDKYIPQLKNRFLEIMQLTKNAIDVEQLAIILERGDVNSAIALINNALVQFASSIDVVFFAAGDKIAADLQDSLRVAISFDHVSEFTLAEVNRNRLNLIREMQQEQLDIIRTILEDGFRRGINPRDMAREFRSTIGLTAYQDQIVRNFRAQLERNSSAIFRRILRDRRFDPTIRRAIRNKVLLSKDQIDLMVSRYRDRWLKHRAENIARTEAIHGANAGNHSMFEQSIRDGYLQPGDLVVEWLIGGGPRTRDSHRAMSHQKIKFGETFISGNGNRLRYPGDTMAPANDRINCRCTTATRIVSL